MRKTRYLTLLTAFVLVLGLPAQVQVQVQAQAPDAVLGDWTAELALPNGQELTLVIHVEEAEGGLTSTLDSPDQGAAGIPIAETTFTDGTLFLKAPALAIEMDLTPTEEGGLEGRFRQGPLDTEIAFTRQEGEVLLPPRPQTPEPPFPYTALDASIDVPGQDTTLAGELFIPEGSGPFPGAVLLTGSGAQDRDETLFGHKPFLVLADHLARRGVAVLRYDDRGYGESTGSRDGLTMEGIALDGAAALAWLKARPEVDADRAGFIGHSEGGTTGPMATRTQDAAFMVLIAPVAVPFRELLQEQSRLLSEAAGASAEAVSQNVTVQGAILDAAALPTADGCRDAASQALGQTGLAGDQLNSAVDFGCSAWMRHALALDPLQALRSFDGPVLAVFGEKDLQVPPAQNAGPMADALSAAGHPLSRMEVLPELNHLMQPAETGTVAEYGQIEITMDPKALEMISGFIAEAAEP